MTDTQLPCLILGAGGHAKVVIDALRSVGREIIGILTPDIEKGASFMGIPILGDDKVINQYQADQILLINGLGSLPGKDRRWFLADKYRGKNYQFGQVMHSNTSVSSDVLLSEGVQLMNGVIIQPSCKIGLDTIINTGSLIDHDCSIGSRCHIAPGVTLSGGVTIGDSVHIGTGVKVIQGVHIGNGTIVAAGTTVCKDILENTLVRFKNEFVIENLKDI